MLQKLKIYSKTKNLITLRKIGSIYFFNPNFNKNVVFSIHTNTYLQRLVKKYYIYTYMIYIFRIIWRGKAYRIRFFKKYNKFTLNFGHSHWLKIIYNKKFFYFSRLRRQNYTVFFFNRVDIHRIASTFNNLRKFNKYTRRGIRLKKTHFLKRFGKISQVNSILHNF